MFVGVPTPETKVHNAISLFLIVLKGVSNRVLFAKKGRKRTRIAEADLREISAQTTRSQSLIDVVGVETVVKIKRKTLSCESRQAGTYISTWRIAHKMQWKAGEQLQFERQLVKGRQTTLQIKKRLLCKHVKGNYDVYNYNPSLKSFFSRNFFTLESTLLAFVVFNSSAYTYIVMYLYGYYFFFWVWKPLQYTLFFWPGRMFLFFCHFRLIIFLWMFLD